jgi:hypothetical protein
MLLHVNVVHKKKQGNDELTVAGIGMHTIKEPFRCVVSRNVVHENLILLLDFFYLIQFKLCTW